MAKFKLAMEVLSPFATSPMQTPIVAARRFAAAEQAHREVLEKKYAEASRRKNYGGAAMFMQADCLSPVLAYLAKEHPEAGASVVGRSFLTPNDPFGAVAGYLAWGQAKKADREDVVEAAAAAELKRRAPSYALLFATSATQNPLDLAFPFLALDRTVADPRFMEMGFVFENYVHPLMPLETVEKEIEQMLVRETAREWAQANIRIARRALEKASGSKEHFKRDLAKLIPELKLTYGPPEDKKGTYYDRYSVNDAKELAPLKEAFEKHVDIINFAEGRDVTPDKLLKPGDFYKMFFDPTELFSAATTKYHAMPWPPKVKTNASRAWKSEPDPRYINRKRPRDQRSRKLCQLLEACSRSGPEQAAPRTSTDSSRAPTSRSCSGAPRRSNRNAPPTWRSSKRICKKMPPISRSSNKSRKTEKDPAGLPGSTRTPRS